MASKKRTETYPGPFRKNNVLLTAARIDTATEGIDVTATGINNNTAAARINNITTGISDFSIRTF
jgi:hypothetical protein